MNDVTPVRFYWAGTEEQQDAECMKACRERRAKWGDDECEDKDGSCEECMNDIHAALRVTEAEFHRLVKDEEIAVHDC